MGNIFLEYNGLAKQIISNIYISDSLKESNINNSLKCKGLWDTGATQTVISRDIVKKLNLQAFSKTVISGVNGFSETTSHVVDVWLSENFVIRRVNVFKGQLVSGIDVLIGMDIISRGNFSLTNINGRTIFSFIG